MAEKKVIIEIDIDAKKAVHSVDNLNKAIKEQNAILKKSDAGSDVYKQAEKNVAKLTTSKNILVKATKEEVKIAELTKIATTAVSGSYNQLSAQYSLNVIALNKMSQAEKKTTDKGKKLVSETNKLRTAMSEAKKATGDHRLEVGNYKIAADALNEKLALLRTEEKNLNVEVKRSKVGFKQASKEVKGFKSATTAQTNAVHKASMGYKTNATRLKEVKTQIALTKRELRTATPQVNNFGKSFLGVGRNIMGALGITAGLTGLFRVIKGGISTITKFQQKNANLAAILNTTRGEIKDLTKDALDLGSTTEWTASQVVELQEAYARLGFTKEEIKGVTEATLQGATALRAGLGDAAELVGGTLRGFQEDVSKTQEYVDVMTASTTNSALTFEKLKTGLGVVSPVAKQAGETIQTTAAYLGTLANNNVDASTSATGLRNIFLEVAKQGITVDEAFRKINTSTNKNATALDLFGKRGATVATILATQSKETDILEEKLNNAGGTAERVANEQLATIEGKTKLLSSAWEGLILKLNESEAITSTLGAGLVLLTEELTTAGDGVDGLNKTITSDSIPTWMKWGRTIESMYGRFGYFSAASEYILAVDAERVKNMEIFIATAKKVADGNDEYAESLLDIVDASNFTIAVKKTLTKEINAYINKLEEEKAAAGALTEEEIKAAEEAEEATEKAKKAAIKAADEKYKKLNELEKLRIELMDEGVDKEQEAEKLRYKNYIKQWGESEEALLVHTKNLLKIVADYEDAKEEIRLEKEKKEKEAEEKKNKKQVDDLEKSLEQIEKDNDAIDKRMAGWRAAEIEKEQKDKQKKLDIAKAYGAELSDIVNASIDESGLNMKKFGKNLLIFMLDLLKKQTQAAIATAVVGSFATPQSVATAGTMGVVQGALLTGLIEAAFGVAKGIISRPPQGLATGTPQVTQAGQFIVGEQGPEMVNLPVGAAVIPNSLMDFAGFGNFAAPQTNTPSLTVNDLKQMKFVVYVDDISKKQNQEATRVEVGKV